MFDVSHLTAIILNCLFVVKTLTINVAMNTNLCSKSKRQALVHTSIIAMLFARYGSGENVESLAGCSTGETVSDGIKNMDAAHTNIDATYMKGVSDDYSPQFRHFSKSLEVESVSSKTDKSPPINNLKLWEIESVVNVTSRNFPHFKNPDSSSSILRKIYLTVKQGTNKSDTKHENAVRSDKIRPRAKTREKIDQRGVARSRIPTELPRKNTKRASRGRRFLSNVHSSLKEHVKKAETAWRMSSKEVKNIFERYYECQTERVKSLKKEEFPIKALLAVEGESVQMTCTVCYRPDQSEDLQRAEWQVLRHTTSALEDLTSGSRIHISKDHTLLIKDIDLSDAGQYFCVERWDYAAVYHLDVFLTDKRRNVRLGEDTLTPDVYLLTRNLHVFTMWAPWGECNTCDRPGRKTRVGQCTAKKIYPDIPIFPRDYPLMALYPDGVPCHSTALPRHIRNIGEIGSRESETQISPCMESCPTEPPIVTITDETGKVVEVLEPGYHSMRHKPPELLPLIKRKAHFEPEKSHLVLNCPTKSKPELIHWTKREREVDPGEIKSQTKGRVWVDTVSRLHFNPVLLSDTDVYYCWSKNSRVAVIKLIVVDKNNQNLKYYISCAGMAATAIGSLLCLFCICCKKSDKNAR